LANLLIRDLDDDVVKQLKAAAKAHGRSLQAEIHDALQRAGTRSLAETRRISARWMKQLRGLKLYDSASLLRDDRNSR
jgi:plasmid stability protein